MAFVMSLAVGVTAQISADQLGITPASASVNYNASGTANTTRYFHITNSSTTDLTSASLEIVKIMRGSGDVSLQHFGDGAQPASNLFTLTAEIGTIAAGAEAEGTSNRFSIAYNTGTVAGTYVITLALAGQGMDEGVSPLEFDITYTVNRIAIPTTQRAISGVSAPTAGATAFTVNPTTSYTGTVSWQPQLVHNVFAANTAYTATISLSALPNYTFLGVPASGQAGGMTVPGSHGGTVTAEAGSGTTHTMTIVFPATGNSLQVTDRVIREVNVPVKGGKPNVTFGSSIQWSGTMEWDPEVGSDGLFAAETEYTAVFTLAAGPGRHFTGLSTTSWGVNGAVEGGVTFNAATGVVRARFPMTDTLITVGAEDDDDLKVHGIAAPVAGEEPVTEVVRGYGNTPSNNELFSGTVTWSPAIVGGRFAPLTIYTATITLTPIPTHTFRGINANSLEWIDDTGNPVLPGTPPITSATNNADGNVFTVVFERTADLLDIANAQPIIDVTAPVVGEMATTRARHSATPADNRFTGTVTWTPDLLHGRFAAETDYTATITLTAEPGYTFRNFLEDREHFTVAGSDIATWNQGGFLERTTYFQKVSDIEVIVTAEFPKTSIANINGTVAVNCSDTLIAGIGGIARCNILTTGIPAGPYTVMLHHGHDHAAAATAANSIPHGINPNQGTVIIDDNGAGVISIFAGTTLRAAVGNATQSTAVVVGLRVELVGDGVVDIALPAVSNHITLRVGVHVPVSTIQRWDATTDDWVNAPTNGHNINIPYGDIFRLSQKLVDNNVNAEEMGFQANITASMREIEWSAEAAISDEEDDTPSAEDLAVFASINPQFHFRVTDAVTGQGYWYLTVDSVGTFNLIATVANGLSVTDDYVTDGEGGRNPITITVVPTPIDDLVKPVTDILAAGIAVENRQIQLPDLSIFRGPTVTYGVPNIVDHGDGTVTVSAPAVNNTTGILTFSVTDGFKDTDEIVFRVPLVHADNGRVVGPHNDAEDVTEDSATAPDSLTVTVTFVDTPTEVTPTITHGQIDWVNERMTGLIPGRTYLVAETGRFAKAGVVLPDNVQNVPEDDLVWVERVADSDGEISLTEWILDFEGEEMLADGSLETVEYELVSIEFILVARADEQVQWENSPPTASLALLARPKTPALKDDDGVIEVVAIDDQYSVITGIGGTHEYRRLPDTDWTKGADVPDPMIVTHSVYQVRVAPDIVAHPGNIGDSKFASAILNVVVGDAIPPEATPMVTASDIDYAAERLGGLEASRSYLVSVGGAAATSVNSNATGSIAIPAAWMGQSITLVLVARDENWSNSPASSPLAVPARPAAPTGLGAVEINNDDPENVIPGKVTGLTAAMEFRVLPATAWTSITSAMLANGEMEVTVSGEYVVRYAATSGAFASVSAEAVTVGSTISILEIDRENPTGSTDDVAVFVPVSAASKFVVGPSPVAIGGTVQFFGHSGAGSLRVFDATGSIVREVNVADGWDLKDARGRYVAEGTYVVRGTLVIGNERVRVSVPVTVVK
jgi:hypothetical protein